MLERFTAPARRVVTETQLEMRALHHGHVGTEHLLLALLRQPAEPAAALLVRHGLDLETARAAVQRLLGESGATIDGAALETIGIDLDMVTARVEAAFGVGALANPGGAAGRGRTRTQGRGTFTTRARKVLELAVRAAQGRGDSSIGTGHLLLGMVREGGGLAVGVLRDHGLDLAEVERETERSLGADAA
ncbi:MULTISPECIES: Clp protease N-terminal domain-containing protein [Streptacidiphilus]|uniref:Clp protease N-terminal domain-containing protein n=1 Tax=Streptacidiphilus cavernicola TaxID=3342716 RepID=A0ABV6UTS7_9ACTN|nr:Clp protease N-terminal domain-containing protein [Streptacidiphilus jeojiense]